MSPRAVLTAIINVLLGLIIGLAVAPSPARVAKERVRANEAVAAAEDYKLKYMEMGRLAALYRLVCIEAAPTYSPPAKESAP